jgi:hypothetical protein
VSQLVVGPAGQEHPPDGRKGDTGNITISNVFQSNGVIHVFDTVLLPN